MTMLKVTIKEFAAQKGFALAKVKSAIYRNGTLAVGSRGQELMYYLVELEAATQPRVKVGGYVKKVTQDYRPDGSLTIQEFSESSGIKYCTIDSRLRRAETVSDGFVYKGQYKCKTYPLAKFNKLST